MANPLDKLQTTNAIGRDGLLRLIDDINAKRANAGNCRRFRPHIGQDGVMVMHEIDEVMRPENANTPSPRYSHG